MVGERKMATVGRKQTKRKQLQEDCNQKVFDFHQEDDKKALSGSEDEAIGDETVIVDKVAKKRAAAELDEEEAACAIGTNEVYSMLEKFGADISKGMQAKKKRLELLTKNYMKGSQHKLEQLWSSSHSHRKKMTQQYSQKVNSALQQWESEAQRAVDQEEKLNSLFRQQQKILQQARVARDQKLKLVRELYEQFIKLCPPAELCFQTLGDVCLAGHGGYGEGSGGLPAGGAAGAEEGDVHAAEEDPHGHAAGNGHCPKISPLHAILAPPSLPQACCCIS
ncbi:synaptonemal complex protein 3 isoform X2 [Gouania willdenowi]|uniref:synaptonemal complex protein 3 isoform X2 n=1 Tax=Gouania willdenowi TaxID=441366 RepID=UPI0010554DF6|nr:synaptonemal complex protein 3 isoform X2 [Gouania willdenowi]